MTYDVPARATTRLKYGPAIAILPRIIECETMQENLECVLIGTIYKEMQLKPSVLDEFKDHYGISGVVQPIKNYASAVSIPVYSYFD